MIGTRFFRTVLLLVVVMLCYGASGAQWYKGSLHIHSLWSDGDAAPEVPVSWYRENGWHFVCLTDHNIRLEGERFRSVDEESNPTPAQFDALQQEFGPEWTAIEIVAGRTRMRLKTFQELKAYFEDPEEFILLHGEEITTLAGNPHVGAINTVDVVGMQAPADIITSSKKYYQAVESQQRKYNQPMLAIMNHPCFADAVTIEEMLQLPEFRFFEVYNGHPSVNNWGQEKQGYPSTDRFWDVVLAMRLQQQQGSNFYGIAADDSHNYFEWGTGQANPGRGWVMVKADRLEVGALLEAMNSGEFYASTGVVLDEILEDESGLSFKIIEEEGVSFTTRFIGTRKGFSKESSEYRNTDGEMPERASRVYSNDIGVVLLETQDLNPTYRFAGDELYVRALVMSDKKQVNPFREGDVEMAWVQPVLPN